MPFLVTPEHLAAIAGRATALMPDLARWMNELCPQYEIDSPQEYAHFLAQACHETDHFKTLREYASGKAYENRVDLGNTKPGDGVRFKGRGIFQTTGRANYQQLGIKKGQRDLFVNNPELLERPEHAVWSACEYWKTRGLNDIANHADAARLKKKYRGNVIEVSPVEFISITINGGYNGMEERKKFHALAQKVLVEAPASRATPGEGAIAVAGAATRGKPRKASARKAATRTPAAAQKAAATRKARVATKAAAVKKQARPTKAAPVKKGTPAKKAASGKKTAPVGPVKKAATAKKVTAATKSAARTTSRSGTKKGRGRKP